MMTEKFFKSQMDLLIEVFGTAEYPNPRVKIIWDAVSDLPDKCFETIIKHFIRSKPIKYPPLPNEFIEEANRQRMHLNAGSPGPRSDIHDLAPPGEELNNILRKMGVGNLMEAIQKRKQQGGLR